MLFQALTKAEGRIRRYPVTNMMAEAMLGKLNLDDPNNLLRKTAICMGLRFHIRGGEYLVQDGAGFDMVKVLRPANVTC